MFRSLLSSRLIQAGLAFFVLVVGGSLLYSWHDKRTTEKELAPHDRFLQGLEKPNERTPAETVTVPSESEAPGGVNTPDETTPAETIADTEPLDLTDAFESDDFMSAEEAAEEAPEADVPVSPYGFGPYPEIPADYPGTSPMWERDLDALGFTEAQKRGSELLSRVLIKLWVEQGIGSRLGGAVEHDTGLVYPYHPNTIYVKRTVHRNPDGTEKGIFARIVSPGNMLITGEEMERFRLTGETPPSVQVLQLDTDGIDAYEFLNLPR